MPEDELSAFMRGVGEARRFAEAQRTQRDGMRRAMDSYADGVCLIHGVYTLREPDGSQPVVSSEGEETPFRVEYFGSGFLADPRGLILTNRHVAEPWWDDDSVAPLLALGMKPEFVLLTATFPGSAPVAIDPASIRVSPDGADLAVCAVRIADVPVLPLHDADPREFRGQMVMLLGYPTGLRGLLARAEPDAVEQALAVATDADSLIGELSVRGALFPLATHGVLNDATASKLIYDAVTTGGGSGGPVFCASGRVIGVNYAKLRDFQGSNFGVPIRYASVMLEERRRD